MKKYYGHMSNSTIVSEIKMKRPRRTKPKKINVKSVHDITNDFFSLFSREGGDEGKCRGSILNCGVYVFLGTVRLNFF